MAFETFWHDLRHAMRMLRRSPAFTLTAVITLALGHRREQRDLQRRQRRVAAPAPYPSPDRLAMVWMDNARIAPSGDWHSFPDYLDYKQQNTTFETWPSSTARPDVDRRWCC
jgi:hypothetical protein